MTRAASSIPRFIGHTPAMSCGEKHTMDNALPRGWPTLYPIIRDQNQKTARRFAPVRHAAWIGMRPPEQYAQYLYSKPCRTSVHGNWHDDTPRQ
ncbi:hypothetical protein CFR74_05245 [Novacetimonas hansenii]|nr:hypothetical protein CFR74_05245 [Novacetimonas hansenii]